MMLASGLLGRGVDTPAAEDLGEVEDFLVDLNTGNVLFALISHGGFLGIGQDQAAIPLSALSFDETEDELILDVSQEQFDSFPDVDVSNDWPIGLDQTWDDDLSAFWTGAGFDVSFTENVETEMVVRASQLIGYGYGAPTAASLGTIIDYIVDLGQGRVEYVILGFTDVALYGDEWTIVPFQVLDPSTFLLGTDLALDPNIDVEMLSGAPRLQAASLSGADFFSPGWDETVRTYWSEQGYEFD
jgi:sporulation protein YlmC with PRC-barrel domain